MAKQQNRTVSVLPYYPDPQSDDQRLFNMQKEYKDGAPQALAAMYKLLYEVAYKTINNRSATNQHIAALSADERQQKAHDAATYIIEQYCKRPAFVITDSITGYLYLRIRWELYGKNRQYKRDQMLVYMDELPQPKEAKITYRYIVTDTNTGKSESYGSAAEMYLDPKFKGLRKKRLVESIRTGRKWKNYTFDLLEVME